MKKILSIAVLVIFGVQFGHAQTYSPDRPGIGTGSSITPESVFGVEAGLEYLTNDVSEQFSVGQVLLRYGVIEKLELRAGLGSYTSMEIGNISASGLQDMSLGAKYNFLSGADKPTISALAQVSLPVGDDAFTSDEVVPSLSVLADYPLNEMWALASNLGYTFGVANLEDSWLFTLTPGFVLPGNEHMGGYFGYAGMYYGEGINQHWLEGGFTFGLSGGVQLDANLGYETEGKSFFIGAGIAKGF